MRPLGGTLPDPLIAFSAPIRVRSLNSREHWRTKAKRVKAERRAIGFHWLAAQKRDDIQDGPPYVVALYRIGPREMDDDNVVGALKHVRDAVAACLGFKDDNVPELEWQYGQLKGAYAVRVEVYRRASAGRVWAAPVDVEGQLFDLTVRIDDTDPNPPQIDDTDPNPPQPPLAGPFPTLSGYGAIDWNATLRRNADPPQRRKRK